MTHSMFGAGLGIAARTRLAGLTLVAAGSLAAAQTATLPVPGTGNPWLAGMPDGSTASGGDAAPGQSPAQVPFAIIGGSAITFPESSGTTGYSAGVSCPPEGCVYSALSHIAENGLGAVTVPNVSCLMGTFLDDLAPNGTPAPAPMNFIPAPGIDFVTLTPALKQVFFIGDGHGPGGLAQAFVAPAGATRLFLSSMDGSGWYNNIGAFTVTVHQAAGAPCYANCDNSTAAPVLNVLDFNCFLNRFSSGNAYANCDGSTVAPLLNVLDFNCFLNRFSAGCP